MVDGLGVVTNTFAREKGSRNAGQEHGRHRGLKREKNFPVSWSNTRGVFHNLVHHTRTHEVWSFP